MSEDDPRIRLRHVLEHIREARQFVEGRTEADVEQDRMLRRALERSIEIIGEAMSRVPQAMRDRHPEIPWHKAIGMRNWLIHGYHAVKADIVWNTAVEHLGTLERQIEQVLRAEFDENP